MTSKDKLIEKQRELIEHIKKFWYIKNIFTFINLECEISDLEAEAAKEPTLRDELIKFGFYIDNEFTDYILPLPIDEEVIDEYLSDKQKP